MTTFPTRRTIRSCALLMTLVTGLAASDAVSPDMEQVRAHAEALLEIPDRRMGSPGAAQAAEIISQRLQEIGFTAEQMARSRTTVTIPVDHGSSLTITNDDGTPTTITLHPHVANGAALPTTGNTPLSGRLVILGQADDRILDIRGPELNGSIVVLDGDSGEQWMRCAELGAKAAIFRYPERIDRLQLRKQYLTASIDFPRFIADIPDELDGQMADIKALVRMERRQAATISALIPGSAGRRTVILASGYEAGGLIHGHDPAATRAWNAALLLELGRQLLANPPRNNVLLVFHGGRTEHFRGLRELLAILTEDESRSPTIARALKLDLWRNAQVDQALRRFGPGDDLEALTAALRDIDEASLEPFLSDEETTEQRRSEDQASAIAYYLDLSMIILLVLALVLLFTIRLRTGRPGWAALIASTLFIGWILKALLLPPAPERIVTDLIAEQEAVLELGLRFISEEAGRRADENQPVIERLRLLYALGTRPPRDADDPRIEEDRLRIIALREEIALLDPHIDLDDYATLEEVIAQREGRVMLMRNVQQKLGRRHLVPEEANELPDLIRGLVAPEDPDATTIVSGQRQVLQIRHDDISSLIEARSALGLDHAPHLVIGLDFTAGGQSYSACITGPLVAEASRVERIANECRREAQSLNDTRLDGALPFDASPHGGQGNPLSWWPDNYAHEAGVAGLFLNGVTLSTINDDRLERGSPQDDANRFAAGSEGFARFARQTFGLSTYIGALIDRSGFEEYRSVRRGLESKVATVETESRGSATGRKGFPFAYLELRETGAASLGFHGDVRFAQTHWSDAFGRIEVPWLPHGLSGVGNRIFLTVPYSWHADGRLSHVFTRGRRQTAGIQNEGFAVHGSPRDMRLELFAAEASALYGLHHPRTFGLLSTVNILAASRDSAPDNAHVEIDRGAAAIFAPPGVRLRVLARQGSTGNDMALLGDHLHSEDFLGLRPGGLLSTKPLEVLAEQPGPIAVDAQRFPLPTALAAAEDRFRICHVRLDDLQQYGVNPERLWALHAHAQSHLDVAKQAAQDGHVATSEGAALRAWSLSNRVYPALLEVANDVVYGLVVMLILAIPFAVICERLFVSANTIFGKVLGFGGFFIASFLFFFFFHPAFSLAVTPIIIFLAFAIIVMSALVIFIIYKQFETSMAQIRLRGLGTHTADVNRLGTLLATGQLGISNMRRRPMRTFLTATTVVLMAFILLTFAGFGSRSGIRQQDRELSPVYNGVLLSNPGWMSLGDHSVERVRRSWGQDLQVFTRRWLVTDGNAPQIDIASKDGGEPAQIYGIVGVEEHDPTTVDRSLIRVWQDNGTTHEARGFGGEDDWLFLPDRIIDRIGHAPGDHILFRGIRLRLGRIDLDGRYAYDRLSHLNGDPFTPLAGADLDEEQRKHFEEMQRQAEESGEAATLETLSLTHLAADQIGVASAATLARLGGEVRSIALIPWTEEARQRQSDPQRYRLEMAIDLDRLAEDIADELAMSIHLGNKGRTVMMTAVGQLSLGGLADVLIPLILGGMIIYSTMLGSVAERGKEIFIYSSLGLAPLHVAALFLVEAAIYAIIGGMGGYMIAQMIMSGIGLMADLGLVASQPDINYSSFTAVITILMVMATVLLSALYPAWVASKAANPGTEKGFKVPAPVGDDLNIEFPFTVAARDIRGLLAFLKAFMDTNTETSTGSFTAANTVLTAEGTVFSVTAKTWLAPFDLGISQTFSMTAQPTEMKAIYSVHIAMHLLSGQRSAWRRVTIPFIAELRQQFLVWRTLDDETTDRYRAAGGDQEAQQRVAEREAKEREAKKAAPKFGHTPSPDDDTAQDDSSKDQPSDQPPTTDTPSPAEGGHA